MERKVILIFLCNALIKEKKEKERKEKIPPYHGNERNPFVCIFQAHSSDVPAHTKIFLTGPSLKTRLPLNCVKQSVISQIFFCFCDSSGLYEILLVLSAFLQPTQMCPWQMTDVAMFGMVCIGLSLH